jgi:hypothetical protein
MRGSNVGPIPVFRDEGASAQSLVQAMLIPRFSLRLLLWLNAAFASVFLVAKFALDGRAWAWGLLMVVVGSIAILGTFGLMFLAAYVLSFENWRRRTPVAESPFATDKLPPQVIPPRHVDD